MLAPDKSRVVGAVRFELTTSCSQNRRADQAAPRPVADVKHQQELVYHGISVRSSHLETQQLPGERARDG